MNWHLFSTFWADCGNFKMPYFLTDLFSCGAKPEAGRHDLVVYTLYGQLIRYKIVSSQYDFTLCNFQLKCYDIFSFTSPLVQRQCKTYHTYPTAGKTVFYSHEILHSKYWHLISSKFCVVSIPNYPRLNQSRSSLNW